MTTVVTTVAEAVELIIEELELELEEAEEKGDHQRAAELDLELEELNEQLGLLTGVSGVKRFVR